MEQAIIERARAQYRSSGEWFGRMAEKAKTTGKKVNGYTFDQLTERAKSQSHKAEHLTDAEIADLCGAIFAANQRFKAAKS